MLHRHAARLRLLLVALTGTLLGACGQAVDAGTHGGVAFIALTVFLLIGAVILYIALGRED